MNSGCCAVSQSDLGHEGQDLPGGHNSPSPYITHKTRTHSVGDAAVHWAGMVLPLEVTWERAGIGDGNASTVGSLYVLPGDPLRECVTDSLLPGPEGQRAIII